MSILEVFFIVVQFSLTRGAHISFLLMIILFWVKFFAMHFIYLIAVLLFILIGLLFVFNKLYEFRANYDFFPS